MCSSRRDSANVGSIRLAAVCQMASAMEGCEWEVDEAACYIAGDQVLKARVKRRLPSETKDADFVLQNQKRLKLSDMHCTRAGAEAVLAAARPAVGGEQRTSIVEDRMAPGGRRG